MIKIYLATGSNKIKATGEEINFTGCLYLYANLSKQYDGDIPLMLY